jgi:hypothetical protein
MCYFDGGSEESKRAMKILMGIGADGTVARTGGTWGFAALFPSPRRPKTRRSGASEIVNVDAPSAGASRCCRFARRATSTARRARVGSHARRSTEHGGSCRVWAGHESASGSRLGWSALEAQGKTVGQPPRPNVDHPASAEPDESQSTSRRRTGGHPSAVQSNCKPPFMSMTSPVMKPASGDARNKTACATSSGVQNLPTGICAN